MFGLPEKADWPKVRQPVRQGEIWQTGCFCITGVYIASKLRNRTTKMWISEADDQILRTWIKYCPVCKMVSTADEKILYANNAFLEWIGYTLAELQSIGWRKISVDDESLDADLKALREMNDGYNEVYRVQKQYLPKNGKPEWGVLTVMRYPAVGEIKCYLCTWEPLRNGTQAAFTLAMEKLGIMTTAIEGIKNEVKTLTTMDEDATLVNSAIRFVKRHPKVAGVLVALAVSVFGLNNIVELGQRIGLLELPVKIQPVQPAGDVPQANLINQRDMMWSVTTPDGNKIEIPARRDDPIWPVSLNDKL